MPAGGPLISKYPARGSRPETEKNGLAGSRARTMPAGGPRIPKFPARGSRPETENKGLAGSQARTMPAAGPPTLKFSARGSRPETENKGLAGNRARTMPAGGPLISKNPARGSRPETENKGVAGSRARTMPAAGPILLTGGPASMPGGPIPLSADPPRPGPRARFASQRAGSQQKNTGRQPGVYSYPINPIIPAIPADSGRFPRILPGTLSAAEALLRCPLRGWLPRSAEAPDRAGTSAGGTNRCGRSDRN